MRVMSSTPQPKPRLIALDMDGTLLDPQGRIPERFWPVLRRAKEQGVIVAPASGRQLATLQAMFKHGAPEAFIAENGAAVARGGRIVSTTTLPEAPVRRLLEQLGSAPFTAHAVVCAPEVAYTLELPAAIDAEVDKYYASRAKVQSLIDAPLATIIKIALYVESDAERDAYPWVRDTVPELTSVVSGTHWLDVMHPEASKGRALTQLAASLGIDAAETAAFGDYLNDYALLQAAGYAVAVGNAHADLKAIADEVVGTNAEHAVVHKLEGWLS